MSLKDVNSAGRAEIIKIYCGLFGAMGFLGILAGYLLYGGVRGSALGLSTAALISIPLTIIVAFFLGKLGNAAGKLYIGGHGSATVREQMQGELNTIRFLKRQDKYDEALQAINAVLQKDPDFGEALLLKAQILAEGFNKIETAIGYCKKIIQMKDKDETAYRWACGYYGELKNRDNESSS